VVFVDISPEEAATRFSARTEGKSRFEARGIEYFKKVQTRYHDLLEKMSPVIIVNGTDEIETSATTVAQKIIQIMHSKKK
jgi:thymidylate kinase